MCYSAYTVLVLAGLVIVRPVNASHITLEYKHCNLHIYCFCDGTRPSNRLSALTHLLHHPIARRSIYMFSFSLRNIRPIIQHEPIIQGNFMCNLVISLVIISSKPFGVWCMLYDQLVVINTSQFGEITIFSNLRHICFNHCYGCHITIFSCL